MKKIFVLLSIFFFSRCVGLAVHQKVIGNYYLVATDTEEDLSLGYREPKYPDVYSGGVDATVFAVGYDNEYIIVKQHPRDFPNPPNKKVTNYFIVSLTTNKYSTINSNEVIGPLTLKQFNQERKDLEISPDLKFTIVEKDLE